MFYYLEILNLIGFDRKSKTISVGHKSVFTRLSDFQPHYARGSQVLIRFYEILTELVIYTRLFFLSATLYNLHDVHTFVTSEVKILAKKPAIVATKKVQFKSTQLTVCMFKIFHFMNI